MTEVLLVLALQVHLVGIQLCPGRCLLHSVCFVRSFEAPKGPVCRETLHELEEIYRESKLSLRHEVPQRSGGSR